jgi:hypothetical protein
MFPESGPKAWQQVADFPKAGRLSHNFFHRPTAIGFPVESVNAGCLKGVNLLVTQIVKLTRINFMPIR